MLPCCNALTLSSCALHTAQHHLPTHVQCSTFTLNNKVPAPAPRHSSRWRGVCNSVQHSSNITGSADDEGRPSDAISSSSSSSAPSITGTAAPEAAAAAAPKSRNRLRRLRGERTAERAEVVAAAAVQLTDALVSQTQLSAATAARVAAASSRSPLTVPDQDKVCRRVLALQQVLGPSNAALALSRFPALIRYSPESLALNYKQWRMFFGVADADLLSNPMARRLQQARQQGLLHKLCEKPQLLCVNVERQVANLYEMGALIGHEDAHAFAFQAMSLALTGPQVLQDKMEAVLEILNAPAQQQQKLQQQQDRQKQQQVQQQRQAQQRQVEHMGSSLQGDTGVRVFSLADVQAAARRDHFWLGLSKDKLQQRLLGLQEALGVPMSDVGAMFLKSPAVVVKQPSTLASKLEALQDLPGMRPEHAAAMVVAMPQIFGLDVQKLSRRWQLLQEAAESHPTWRASLDTLAPSSLGSLLIRSDTRYTRLEQAVKLGMQHRLTLSTILSVTDKGWEQKVARAQAPPKAQTKASKKS